MSQLPTQLTVVPSHKQVKAAVKENPRLIDQKQVKAIVMQSLDQLMNIEDRMDRLENQGFFGRVWGSITGSTQREMIALMRELTEAQRTTIQLVLTLAVYHAQNVAVMDEILDELDKARGLHTYAASHIEFLYEQVEFIRDSHTQQKSSVSITELLGKSLIVLVIVSGIGWLVYTFWM